MLRRISPLAAAAALVAAALPVQAWNWGSGSNGPPPYPPSYVGYPLDDYSAGYYGGSRYREYYGYGRGFGVADMPGPVPGPASWYSLRLPLPRRDCYPVGPVMTVPLAIDPACALLDVHVPNDAVVLLEGAPTKQTGATRQFVSPPLKSGQDYHYTIKARWKQDGHELEEAREVNVRAGERVNVAFPTAPATEKVSVPHRLPADLSR